MADAQDLKSCCPLGHYGFDSHRDYLFLVSHFEGVLEMYRKSTGQIGIAYLIGPIGMHEINMRFYSVPNTFVRWEQLPNTWIFEAIHFSTENEKIEQQWSEACKFIGV